MFPVASAAVVVYAAGVPAVFYLRLRVRKDVLSAPGPKFQLGFLYRDYREESVKMQTDGRTDAMDRPTDRMDRADGRTDGRIR